MWTLLPPLVAMNNTVRTHLTFLEIPHPTFNVPVLTTAEVKEIREGDAPMADLRENKVLRDHLCSWQSDPSNPGPPVRVKSLL